MKILYIDEAGNTGLDLNNNQQPIFTLCGIVVDEADWYELNHHIQQVKKEISPELISAEIHASEIFNSSKNLKKGFDFRKNPYQKNLEILENIVDSITSIGFDIFCFNIKKDTYLENLKQYLKFDKSKNIVEPYTLSFARMIRAYDNYLIEKNCNGMIFKDEITSVDKELDKLYDVVFSDECTINNIIENALSLDSKKSTFIQLADICNFYINKYYSITLYDKVKNKEKKEHCLKQYEKLKPFINIIDNNSFMI